MSNEIYYKPQPGPIALLIALGCQEHLLDDAYQIVVKRTEPYDADTLLVAYRQAIRTAEAEVALRV